MAGFEIDTDYRRSAYDTKQMSASSIEKGANELTGVLGLCVHTRKTQVSHSIWMQMVHTHILQPTISQTYYLTTSTHSSLSTPSPHHN